MSRRRTAATHGGAAAIGLALGVLVSGPAGKAPEVSSAPPILARAHEPLPAGCSCYTLTGPPKESIVPAVCDDGTKVRLRFADAGVARRAKARACYIVQRAGDLGDTRNPDALFVLREAGP